MSVHITYLVHGTTSDNVDNRASGWNDVELCTIGIQQAQELAIILSETPFDLIFSSDLKRAVHSAEIMFPNHTQTLFQDARLRECNYGDLNGERTSVVEPLIEKMISKPFPNGESYEDVRSRTAAFIDMLRQDCDGKRVAVVSHKAPQLSLDVLLKGKTWEEAFAEDWRKTRAWQPGWAYEVP